MNNFINEEENLKFLLIANEYDTLLTHSLLQIFKINQILTVILNITVNHLEYDEKLKTKLKPCLLEIILIISHLVNYILTNETFLFAFSKGFLEKLKKLKLSKQSNTSKVEKIDKKLSKLSKSLFNGNQYSPILTMCQFLISGFEEKFEIEILKKMISDTILFHLIESMNSVAKNNIKPIKLLSREKELNNIMTLIPSAPFIKARKNPKFLYTLILDMDETLIHNITTNNGNLFFMRPGVKQFLEILSKTYEIIIFTASVRDYADNILNIIDPGKTLIQHRLYRQHCTQDGTNSYKDLSKIGRDITKTLIIDNIADNFKLQKENGLYIKTWEDDLSDMQLIGILDLLLHITEVGYEDIRIPLAKVKTQIPQKTINTHINPYSLINWESEEI
jgi:Dullard-like phosphatase family protein